MIVCFVNINCKVSHAELVSASINRYLQTLKQVQGDAVKNDKEKRVDYTE